MDFYEVVNGFFGMNRNVILRICGMLFYHCNEIRAIMGMCEENYQWRKNSFFVKGRTINFSSLFNGVEYLVGFRPNPVGGCVLTNTPFGKQCFFTSQTSSGSRSVFIDSYISKGIFHWTVRIIYSKAGRSELYLGITPPNRLRDCDISYLGCVEGTCSFGFWRDDNGILKSSLYGVTPTKTKFSKNEPTPTDNEFTGGVACDGDAACLLATNVPNDSFVSVEMNMKDRTLSFLVCGKKIPYVISHLPPSVYVGASARLRPSFTSHCFCRLASATPAPVPCTLFQRRS